MAFQDGGHGGHLGFPIGTILAVFDLQVILMLPTKFQVNWPFGSGEEAKNRISDLKDLSYFSSTSHPMLPNKFQVNWPLCSGEEAKNRFSRWPLPWISDRTILAASDIQKTLMLPSKIQTNWPFGSGE